jgi:hypothetical protein
MINKIYKVPFFNLLLGLSWGWPCWKYTINHGPNWVWFGVVYSTDDKSDVRVLVFHFGPVVVKIGW